MATFVSLPPELLSYLLSFLPGEDLGKICRVCKYFRDAIAVDYVWQRRCCDEFGVVNVNDPELSYYNFYSKVLFRYGRLLGLWQANMGSYGGLFHVMIQGSRLVGVQWLPPVSPHTRRDLRRKLLFTVSVNSEAKTHVKCHKGFNQDEAHDCQLICRSEQGGLCNKFVYKCDHRDKHRHPEGKEQEFASFLLEEMGDSDSEDLFLDSDTIKMKFIATIQYEKGFELERIMLPSSSESILIKPGLFKGQYGSHGIEIVKLSYNEDNTEAKVDKISGDPNIPAGKTSIQVDLCHPMILTEEQQRTLAVLKEIDIPELPPEFDLTKLPRQPFCVPAGCFRDGGDAPKFCKARFHSKGQIAFHGYTSPSFSQGHWIMFDENTFGHMWLKLNSFSLFSRVTEEMNSVMDLTDSS